MTQLPRATPSEIGLESARLEVAYRLLEEWTSEDAPGRIPGAAIVVGRQGKTIAPRFFGRQGPLADDPPIRDDGIFLLASITKPITYTAGMMLVERGLLGLTDRVTDYIPELRSRNTTQSKGEMRVIHLFTHTSGMPDMLPANVELRERHAPLEDFVAGAIDAELLFTPGTDLSYQSMGTLLTAEIVQRLSGKTIQQFVKDEIFDPLKLESSAFGSLGLASERLVRVVTDEQHDWTWNSTYWRQLGSPWGGMFSTPDDLAVICQLFLDGGRCGNVRLLSNATVEAMTTNRLSELPDLPEPIRRTQPWGLGWSLNHVGWSSRRPDPRGVLSGGWGVELVGRRAFGHCGATGTFLWVDPGSGGFCVILTTLLKWKRLVKLSNVIAAAFE